MKYERGEDELEQFRTFKNILDGRLSSFGNISFKKFEGSWKKISYWNFFFVDPRIYNNVSTEFDRDLDF